AQPLELDLTGLTVENIGRPDWVRNGLLPWLRVGGSTPVLYFCAETGPFISGAARLNESLLRIIQDGQATSRS
ncbi:MAG TPA: hypothetical protein VK968_03900, partial [Roseimicrobium sp.]|nr:hypothetical protein [Roseimicrobium sp.]